MSQGSLAGGLQACLAKHAYMCGARISIPHTPHALHSALPTAAKVTMPPPQFCDTVLARTIRNIEQAQGLGRHHATAVDVLRASPDEHPELISLSSSDMAGPAPTATASDVANNIAPAPEQGHPPINLTSDLAASITLLQSLRTRNSILAADLARTTHSLLHHEGAAGKALSSERSRRVKWTIAATCSLATWAVYLWWCWHMRVEFEYIRKRRGEVSGV
jgi:hypothetical protein